MAIDNNTYGYYFDPTIHCFQQEWPKNIKVDMVCCDNQINYYKIDVVNNKSGDRVYESLLIFVGILIMFFL